MRHVLLCLLVGATPGFAEVPLFNGKVFTGAEGARVVVAQLKPARDQRCVVLLTGTGSDFDDVVVPCRFESSWGGFTYFAQSRGSETTVFTTPGDNSGTDALERKFKYDSAESKQLKLEDLWSKHQSQVTSGAVSKLTDFDRAAALRDAAAVVAGATQSFDSSCGTGHPVRFDWSRAPEEAVRANSIDQPCRAAVSLLAQWCDESKSVRRAVAEQLKGIDCRYEKNADSARFTLETGTLVIFYSEHAVPLTDALAAYLKEAL